MFDYFKKTIFRKIALVFLGATAALILSSYYVINWSFAEKDTILDVHDAYLHYKLVESWSLIEDTAAIREELNSLHLLGFVYSLNKDTLCENSSLLWTNASTPVDLCNYGGYNNTYAMLEEFPDVDFHNYYLSFGEYDSVGIYFPATFVAHENLKYLLITNTQLQNELVSFIPSVFLSALFMFFLYLLIRQILYPINLMQRRMLRLEAGDLDSKIDYSSSDELGALSANFNELIDNIKNLLGQKERLLSDVSHEFRTPLSKIRLLLALDPSQQRINKIDKQIKYLDSMITNILLSDTLSVPYSNLELSDFRLFDLFKSSQELSLNKSVENNVDPDLMISGDLIKLSVVIKNVLDNIKKYADNEKPCTIDVERRVGFYNIIIRDFGPGINEDILKKIKEPFVRGKQVKPSGFGLGLAICNKVVLAHGGQFTIANHAGGGAVFTISLPLKQKKGAYAKK